MFKKSYLARVLPSPFLPPASLTHSRKEDSQASPHWLVGGVWEVLPGIGSSILLLLPPSLLTSFSVSESKHTRRARAIAILVWPSFHGE
jgi:hypothetical protein